MYSVHKHKWKESIFTKWVSEQNLTMVVLDKLMNNSVDMSVYRWLWNEILTCSYISFDTCASNISILNIT